MKSQEILPPNKRLDRNQILELEGYRNLQKSGSMFVESQNISKILLAYHNALLAAEEQLEDAEEFVYKDDLREIAHHLPEAFKAEHNI